MTKKKKAPTTLSPSEYERIGRDIEIVVAQGLTNTKRLLFTSFLKGAATGVGAILGATFIITILLWTLSVLGGIPFVGDIFEGIRESIEANPDV